MRYTRKRTGKGSRHVIGRIAWSLRISAGTRFSRSCACLWTTHAAHSADDRGHSLYRNTINAVLTSSRRPNPPSPFSSHLRTLSTTTTTTSPFAASTNTNPTMATAADFPILARLLDNNSKWSSAVNAAEPTFFAQSAKGQAPKVSAWSTAEAGAEGSG